MASTPRPTRTRRRVRATDDPAAVQVQAVHDGQRRRVNLEDAFPNPPEDPTEGPIGAVLPDDLPADRGVADGNLAHPLTSFDSGDSYQKEHELRLLHKFMMRGTRVEVIARALNKTLDEVRRMRRTLFRRLKAEAENLDMLTHAGRTLAYYDEVRGMALRTASDTQVSPVTRMRALEVSLHAENDKHSFLYRAGFYSSTKFTPKSDVTDDRARDANLLARMAQAIVDPTMDDDMVRDLMEQVARDRGADDMDDDMDVSLL